MNFPFWDVPLIGGGMLIGIIAIVHVFVAYLAVDAKQGIDLLASKV